ncbi:MAG: aspartate-semialdehyde dehydrogenase, partial [Alphaproteobacteria bacterium]
LDFWDRKIETSIHSVRYTHRRLIRPGSWRTTQGEVLLN